ncbi:MAG: NAD(P)-binding protein [Candidatus Jordarchaeaceae archaeon]
MKYKSVHNIVLGGGLAGLAYAYGSATRGLRTIIFEKDAWIGGLMKTFNFQQFLFDFGPHVFRSKNKEVLEFVKKLLGNNNYHFISSSPAIFKYGKFFNNVIPIITLHNIRLLPNETKKRIKKEMTKSRDCYCFDNFQDCIISQIGESLYWEFFGEYSRKWWGVDPKKLSSEIAPRNLRIGIKKSYGHVTTSFESVTEEIYPIKGGIFEIARKLNNKLKMFGVEVKTGFVVKSLETNGDIISKIVVADDRQEQEIDIDKQLLISTIPLTVLCDMLNIKCDLTFRAIICVFVGLSGKKLFNYSWIYFHDSDITFGRIHEPIYFSKYNAPKGYTSLCIEVPCFVNDRIWKDKNLGYKVIRQLKDYGIIKGSQEPIILGIARNPYAYPVYTVDYKQKIKEIFTRLEIISNLAVLGRTGAFRYLNMGEVLEYALTKWKG